MIASKIKARFSLRDSARLVGVDLPDRDGKKFASPFRPDNTPSCTVFGDRIHDHSTGESFDAIDLFAHVRGLSLADAIKELGGHRGAPKVPRRTSAPKREPVKNWPDFDLGTPEEIEQLSRLRGISDFALRHAQELGFLRFCDSKFGRCFVVTDPSAINAQARLLSGEKWPDIAAKAKTLPGSKAAHPIGINDIGTAPFVGLFEGGPDLLAGIELLGLHNPAGSFAAVGLLGSSLRIPDEHLAKFAGKVVRIYAHGDDAGRDAAHRWGMQIIPAAQAVEIAHLDEICGDVNDLLNIDLATYRRHEARIVAMLKTGRAS